MPTYDLKDLGFGALASARVCVRIGQFAMAHIRGSRRLPLQGLERIAPLPDYNTEIVAYCRGPYSLHGHQAAALLRTHGFSARGLAGGQTEWWAEARAVQIGSIAATVRPWPGSFTGLCMSR